MIFRFFPFCGALPRAVFLFAAAWAVLGASVAQAGRPLATDDAGIVDVGACQLELWGEFARDSRSLWINPGCNPFGQTEFSLGGARVHPDDGARFHVLSGQVKHALREMTAIQTGFAVALGGERVRTERAHAVQVNGIASVPLVGQSRVVHLNLGARHEREPGQARTRAIWGAALDVAATETVRVALESFGASGERANWQLGVRHALVADRVQLDASVGSPFGRWDAERVFTVGVVIVAPVLR